jgi:hypothetical protein
MRYLCPVLLFLILFIQVSIAVDASPLSCTEQKWYIKELNYLVVTENCTFQAEIKNITIQIVNKKDSHIQEPKDAEINNVEIGYGYSQPERKEYADNSGIVSFSVPSYYLNASGENRLWLKYEIGGNASRELENYTFLDDIKVYPLEYYPTLEISSTTSQFEDNESTVTFTITNHGENDVVPDIGLLVYAIRILDVSSIDSRFAGDALFRCRNAFFCDNASSEILPLSSDVDYSVIPEKLRKDNQQDYALRGDLIHPGVITSNIVDNYAPVDFYLFKDLKVEKDQQISISFNVSFNSSQKTREIPYGGVNVTETVMVEPLYRYIHNTSFPGEYDVNVIGSAKYIDIQNGSVAAANSSTSEESNDVAGTSSIQMPFSIQEINWLDLGWTGVKIFTIGSCIDDGWLTAGCAIDAGTTILMVVPIPVAEEADVAVKVANAAVKISDGSRMLREISTLEKLSTAATKVEITGIKGTKYVVEGSKLSRASELGLIKIDFTKGRITRLHPELSEWFFKNGESAIMRLRATGATNEMIEKAILSGSQGPDKIIKISAWTKGNSRGVAYLEDGVARNVNGAGGYGWKHLASKKPLDPNTRAEQFRDAFKLESSGTKDIYDDRILKNKITDIMDEVVKGGSATEADDAYTITKQVSRNGVTREVTVIVSDITDNPGRILSAYPG